MNNFVEEVNVKGVLKSSIFVVEKATAPKTGVEFRQGSIGAIGSSLATSYDAVGRCSEICYTGDTHRQPTYGLYSEVALGKN